jgi:hypothetical protein
MRGFAESKEDADGVIDYNEATEDHDTVNGDFGDNDSEIELNPLVVYDCSANATEMFIIKMCHLKIVGSVC